MLNILMAGFMFLIFSQPVLGEEREFSVYQGMVDSSEGMPNYIIVNEREIPLSDNVEIRDSMERDAKMSDLRRGKWVYIVLEQSPDGLKAKRIYLLPKYIKKSEKDNYSFMKREEGRKE